MKTFLSLAAAVIALSLTAVKLVSPADAAKAQASSQYSQSAHRAPAKAFRA
jgi:hypothetical protein